MKTLFLLVTVSALALAPHSDENERLNKLLDDRVKANREILKENLAIYDDVDDSKPKAKKHITKAEVIEGREVDFANKQTVRGINAKQTTTRAQKH